MHRAIHRPMHRPMHRTARQAGFTLIELVMVIVIMGVVGGMVAVFMKSPIDAYLASARRAALTDVADTAVRRMARDLQGALPNSIRTATSAAPSNCLQFIPTKTGGRYRAAGAGSLDFTAGSNTFNMLGSNTVRHGLPIPLDQRIVPGDVVVVYNLGFAPADAYTGNNFEVVGGTNPLVESAAPVETTIPLTAPVTFPLESGSRRFHVVPQNERMVSYECIGTNLRRATSNAFAAAATCPLAGATAVNIVATNVNCATTATWFNYAGNDLLRNGLVSMGLTLRDETGTEAVTLQHQVQVSNTP